ncbi:MAG: hypothetical protein R3E31_11615 [Chloroflexota bacterium]
MRDTLLPFALFAALTLLETIPNLYPSIARRRQRQPLNDVHGEHVTGWLGLTRKATVIRTVAQRPASSPLETDYQAGQTPRRF